MDKKKKRVNLYLTVAHYERAQALTALVPGLSVSGLIDEMLAESLDMYEEVFGRMTEMAKDENRGLQGEMMSRLLADQLLALANEGVKTIHTIQKARPETGDRAE